MLIVIASDDMPRTTVNIDASVLRQLKRRQRREGKSLSDLVSELLAAGMEASPEPGGRSQPLRWATRPMGALIDLEDKEALHRVLDAG